MPHRHLIRLRDAQHSQWLALDRAGRVLSGPTDGLPAAPAEETVVLVPSDEVLLLQAPRVARHRRQLEQAIGYAIEDQLVAPVEQAQVAVFDDAATDFVTVAVVARARLDAWLERLAAQGVVADRLLPEGWLLPATPPSLLVDGERATLRHAPAGMLCGTLSEAEGWLQVLRAQGDTRAWTLVADRTKAALPDWVGELSLRTVDVATWLAGRLVELKGDAANLLVGSYAPRRRRAQSSRLWRSVAVLLAASVLLALASMLLESWQLDRQYTQQRAQMEALLREALPGTERIVDPRAQMLGELGRRRGQAAGSGVLPMLARIAPLLAGSGRYTPEAIEFRGGTLDLTLRSADIATLDELRERIASLGFTVELGSMVPGSSGVEGKLRIRGGGA